MASLFPKDPKKLKAKLQRYERALRQEQKIHGGYVDDSGGARYLLGPMYLLLGDNAGALKSFNWFAATFPDDVGEPGFWLCWVLALYRAGEKDAAATKLQQAMLANLYVIPHLLGQPQAEYDIRHGSTWDHPDYIQYIPPELFGLWDDTARQWASEQYHGPHLAAIRERYIEIYRLLKNTPVGPERTALISEAYQLKGGG
jgi:tetratricopeptide (TPR) repeat protein